MTIKTRSFAIAFALSTLAATLAAAPKIESEIAVPPNPALLQISPQGARVAAATLQGSRQVIVVDGQAGPRYDGFYNMLGRQAFIPGNAQFPAKESDHPVMFSPDGTRYAYVAIQGDDYVVVVDGQEVHRGKRGQLFPLSSTSTPLTPKPQTIFFSPLGKRYWFLADAPDGAYGKQLFIDGKPGPLVRGSSIQGMVIFSPDETRWAYADKDALWIDGKKASYTAEEVYFLPKNNAVVARQRITTPTEHLGAVTLDGKTILNAKAVSKIQISSTGRIAALALPDFNTPLSLWVDGKYAAGTEGVSEILFSPDGKRLAAYLNPQSGRTQVWLDGKLSEIYPSIQNWPGSVGERLRFTPDSSRCLFVAAVGAQAFLIDNLAEGNAVPNILSVATGAGSYGYSSASGRQGIVTIERKRYPHDKGIDGHSLRMSPDGKRFSYALGPLGDYFFDGQPLPGFSALKFTKLGGPLTGDRQSDAFVTYSPDSKHAVYGATNKQDRKRHLYSNGRPFHEHPERGTGVEPPVFTADSKHLYWSSSEVRPDGRGQDRVIYLNGRQLGIYNRNDPLQQAIEKQPGNFVVGADHKLRYVASTPEGVIRVTVTPDSSETFESCLANYGAGQTAHAAPAEATTAKAVAVAPVVRNVIAQPIASSPVAALSWNDLHRRKEAWPTTATINRELRFSDGAVVRANTPIAIIEVKPNAVLATGNRGTITFEVEAEATDVLDVANAAWAQLNDAQRALTYATLLKSPELWPYRVKLAVDIQLSGVRSPKAGEAVKLLKLDGRQLVVGTENNDVMFNLEPENTDLLAQARGFLATQTGAPGRMQEELNGNLFNPATGARVAVDLDTRPQYVVLYMGAGWCGPCKVFAPKLSKLFKDKNPDPKNAPFYFLSGDKTTAQTKAYAASLGVQWPTLSFTARNQIPAFQELFTDVIPQLVVADRHGSVIIDSSKIGTDRALAELAKLL